MSDNKVHTLKQVIEAADEDNEDEMAELFATLRQPQRLDRAISENPALLRISGPTGWSLLHVACKINLPDVVNILIRHEAELDARCHKQSTPIHIALDSGALECARLLIDNGCNVNVSDQWEVTPLLLAARLDSPIGTDLLTDLLLRRASILSTDISKQSVLHALIESCLNIELMRERLRRIRLAGGDCLMEKMDVHGYTPLLRAVAMGNCVVTTLLLEANARIDAVASNGKNILHLVAQSGTIELMETLRESLKEKHISNLDIRTPDYEQDTNAPLLWFKRHFRRPSDDIHSAWFKLGREEEIAFEDLLRTVRDATLMTEVRNLKALISRLRESKYDSVRVDLQQLRWAKLKAGITSEAETFRAIELDLRGGRIDLAIESLQDYIEVSQDMMGLSPLVEANFSVIIDECRD